MNREECIKMMYCVLGEDEDWRPPQASIAVRKF